MDIATAQQASDLISQIKGGVEQQTAIGAAVAAKATVSSGTLNLTGGPDGALSIPAMNLAETAALLQALLAIFQGRIDSAKPALTAVVATIAAAP